MKSALPEAAQKAFEKLLEEAKYFDDPNVSEAEKDKRELEIYRDFIEIKLSPLLKLLVDYKSIGTPEEIALTIKMLLNAVLNSTDYIEYLQSLLDGSGVRYNKPAPSEDIEIVPKSKMN